MEHIDETKKSDTHPQAHAVVKKRSAMPALAAEIIAAATVGFGFFMGSNDWKQGVFAFLCTLAGGGIHRGGVWMTNRK